jgi:hypothetical protein
MAKEAGNELTILALAASTIIVLSRSPRKQIDSIMSILSKRMDNSYGTDCRNNKVTMTKQRYIWNIQ